jgi:MinD superfamily P-loop ATPase
MYRVNSKSKLVEGRLRVGALTPVPVIKETIKASLDSEIVILDAPPGTSCPFIHTISKADYVLLVTEPTPFGLNDLKLSIQIVRQMEKPFSVIINRAGLGSDDVYKYLKKEKIKISMELQFDKEIAMIYSSGKLVIESRADIYQKFVKLSESIIHN